MAELTADSCCSTEAQAACCDPQAKETCCGEAAAGRRCGCSEGEPDTRKTVRAREPAT
jgi:hypothetical protein